ncbi:MAG: DUF362 domain-containing protein [Candidatus Aminicenantes bacterium]|nr:DUF362 domain-containing protein [Candidatus Aminicenantes bacterium]
MASKVYFVRAARQDGNDLLSRKVLRVFSEVGPDIEVRKDDFVALKIHFGEKGNQGYIRPDWLSGIIDLLKKKTSRLYITDTNTLYRGQRSNSVEHLLLAAEHGFSLEKLGIPVIIADGFIGRDTEEISSGRQRIQKAKLAGAFLNTDYLVCLSHFTGHLLTGFGAAIKNLGMGCASRAGKLDQHSVVHPWIKAKACKNCWLCMEYCPANAIEQGEASAVIIDEKCIGCGECLVICNAGAVKMRWDEDVRRVQEKIAEYAFSVGRLFEGKLACLSVLLRMTKNCDCMSKDEPVIIEDIGILGSSDPVAIDKASVDLVNRTYGEDLLRKTWNVDWSVQLKHAQDLGLGSMEYKLIELTL